MNNISSEQNNYPAHIAIIMDGNRRWARQKNLIKKCVTRRNKA